ncbi:hypothetical protein GGX14DRAFT_544574 [Mycena pura]|uniref:Uncharacterized protein n=1 Tax=Mycena pura TaxID=153505 RepID=A0AAD6V6E4_9AGAR|nr:hypothetical protein GGX14DRAFT_544574 [Mycena pura]
MGPSCKQQQDGQGAYKDDPEEPQILPGPTKTSDELLHRPKPLGAADDEEEPQLETSSFPTFEVTLDALELQHEKDMSAVMGNLFGGDFTGFEAFEPIATTTLRPLSASNLSERTGAAPYVGSFPSVEVKHQKSQNQTDDGEIIVRTTNAARAPTSGSAVTDKSFKSTYSGLSVAQDQSCIIRSTNPPASSRAWDTRLDAYSTSTRPTMSTDRLTSALKDSTKSTLRRAPDEPVARSTIVTDCQPRNVAEVTALPEVVPNATVVRESMLPKHSCFSSSRPPVPVFPQASESPYYLASAIRHSSELLDDAPMEAVSEDIKIPMGAVSADVEMILSASAPATQIMSHNIPSGSYQVPQNPNAMLFESEEDGSAIARTTVGQRGTYTLLTSGTQPHLPSTPEAFASVAPSDSPSVTSMPVEPIYIPPMPDARQSIARTEQQGYNSILGSYTQPRPSFHFVPEVSASVAPLYWQGSNVKQFEVLSTPSPPPQLSIFDLIPSSASSPSPVPLRDVPYIVAPTPVPDHVWQAEIARTQVLERRVAAEPKLRQTRFSAPYHFKPPPFLLNNVRRRRVKQLSARTSGRLDPPLYIHGRRNEAALGKMTALRQNCHTGQYLRLFRARRRARRVLVHPLTPLYRATPMVAGSVPPRLLGNDALIVVDTVRSLVNLVASLPALSPGYGHSKSNLPGDK